MRRLWLPIMITGLLVSAFCIFYVAVGAAAEEASETEPEFPRPMIEKQEAYFEYMEFLAKTENSSAKVLSLKDGPCSFSAYAPDYNGDWGIYEIAYTVTDARVTNTLTEDFDIGYFAENNVYSDGKLSEGYTFLLVDVIIENKDTEKQMYLVNSLSGAEGMLGFTGQCYRNTAIFHKELYPGMPFETTIVYAAKKDRPEELQLYLNNFGVGSADGNCVYIDLEIE